jgi:hypothetical protein
MEKRILYKSDDGGVVVVIPSPEAVSMYGIEQIALKDVPHGKPFKIVDVSEVPEDRTFRNAWEIDESILTDGVGAEFDSF